jgi:hypothetical protein
MVELENMKRKEKNKSASIQEREKKNTLKFGP